jgi:probable rRNA maturation factor
MIVIQIAEELASIDFGLPIDAVLLQRAAREVMDYIGGDMDVDITIILTDDAQIHELNKQYRGIDAPTDVLSFPSGDTDPDSNRLYLGDVVISYPRAQAQAEAGGHPVEAELQLLVVHGVLHLSGYDHVEEQGKSGMIAAQADILVLLGCDIAPPPL